MARLAGIKQADPTQFTATMGSESVTISFDKSLMTGRWDREVRKAVAAEDIDTVVDSIFGVLSSWDVVDEQGAPVSLTADVLLDLPSAALVSLFERMSEAAQPSSAEGNASGSTSSTAPMTSTSTPESLPNGQEPSPSPPSSTVPSPT